MVAYKPNYELLIQLLDKTVEHSGYSDDTDYDYKVVCYAAVFLHFWYFENSNHRH